MMAVERRRRRRSDWIQLGAYLGVVTVAALGFWAHQIEIKHNQDAIRRTEQARIALCALRADLDRRITAGAAFLNDHPRGIPGISASAIRVSIKNSKRTRKALKVLDCPGGST